MKSVKCCSCFSSKQAFPLMITNHKNIAEVLAGHIHFIDVGNPKNDLILPVIYHNYLQYTVGFRNYHQALKYKRIQLSFHLNENKVFVSRSIEDVQQKVVVYFYCCLKVTD